MMDTAHCSCIVKIWAMLLLLLLLSQSKYSVYHILKSHADNGGDNLLLWTHTSGTTLGTGGTFTSQARLFFSLSSRASLLFKA